MKINKNKNDFLLTFFEKDEYFEKEINGWWLIKSYNKSNKKWRVSIFSAESYKKYKDNERCLVFERKVKILAYNNE